ncbi:UGSC family (seleno)protein, partial [Chloroflexota bacterium]
MKFNSGEIDLPDSLEAFNDYFMEKGWGDGLPLIPPTRERVEAMLARSPLPPDYVIGEVAPKWAVATPENIAINAVMAGCKPEYFVVVMAAVVACLDPDFNLYGVQTTTNSSTPMILVNGPIAKQIGMNSKIGAFGQGCVPNATIGRAVRLVLINIGGALHGEMDRATQGWPGKYTFCAAENEEENPWEPLHVERGFDPSTSTVTVAAVYGFHNIIDIAGQTADEVLAVVSAGIAAVGTNNMANGGEPVIVFAPEKAKTICDDGFSKDDVKRFLYEHA